MRSGDPASSRSRRWWHDAVVYQVYPRSFADGDGDGIGDLHGLLARIDHLHRLGVDVVWSSPVTRSPQADNGYDVSDYRDVDPVFGTLADLDAVIAALHERGMRFVMDVVFNHSSDEHPWFLAAASSRDDPHRDYYHWRPPRAGHVGGEPGAEPNNWGAVFSGPAWSWHPTTGEYVLGVFSPAQPDLNWEHPPLRREVHDVLRFWIERGVDGFRMDVINFIAKDPALPDGPVSPGGRYGSFAHATIDQPRVHDHLRELRREVLGDREDILLIGEMPGTTVEHARRYTDPARGELDMVVQFEHTELDHGPGGKWDPVPLHLPDLKASLARWQTGLAEVGWNSLYLSNHDQPRSVSRFGDDHPDHRCASAKALATVLHLHRGTPFVYQGEELGMANAPLVDADDLRDLESRNHLDVEVAAGRDPDEVLASLRPHARDHARTPMQWDAGPHAGFTTGEPWAPVNPDHVEVNAAAQVDDPTSVFAHYQRLIALRHADPLVVDGRFVLLLPDHEQVYAFRRDASPGLDRGERRDRSELGGASRGSLLVVANLSSSPVTLDADELAELELGRFGQPLEALGSPGAHDPWPALEAQGWLPAWAWVVRMERSSSG